MDMSFANSALSHTAPGVAACVSWLPFGTTGWSPLTANVQGVLAWVGVTSTLIRVEAGAGEPDDPQPANASAATKDSMAAEMTRPCRTPQVSHHLGMSLEEAQAATTTSGQLGRKVTVALASGFGVGAVG